jgi:phosphatidylserine/phosphatidylglycerophosphate/cardiolipin synthase-like enzyme
MFALCALDGEPLQLTAGPEWDQAFGQLARAGAHIRLHRDGSGVVYIHAKAIAADAGLPGQEALVESQNLSAASLGYNRELGILTRDSPVVATIGATPADNYAGAEPYSPTIAAGYIH